MAIVIIIVMFFLNDLKSLIFTNGNNIDQKKIVRIDSVKVVYYTDTVKGSFESKNPTPINVKNYYTLPKNASNNDYYLALIKELQQKYDRKIDSLDLLKELLEAKKIREYVETKEDSFLIATIKSTTKGTLENQLFTYTLKPQSITAYDKTITTKNKPLYSVLLGANIQTSVKELNNSAFGLNLGLQNKKGNIFEIGYNTQQQFNFAYKKILFSKY